MTQVNTDAFKYITQHTAELHSEAASCMHGLESNWLDCPHILATNLYENMERNISVSIVQPFAFCKINVSPFDCKCFKHPGIHNRLDHSPIKGFIQPLHYLLGRTCRVGSQDGAGPMETDHRALGFEHSMDLGPCFLLAVRVVLYPTPAPGHKVKRATACDRLSR